MKNRKQRIRRSKQALRFNKGGSNGVGFTYIDDLNS